MTEVLFLGMSQSAPYFSHTCNYSYRGKRVQDNLCKTPPPPKKKDHKSVTHRTKSVQLPYTAY